MNGNRHGQIPLLAHRAVLLQPTESTKPDTGPSAEKERISYFIVKHLQIMTQSLDVREMKMPREMNAIYIESQVLLNLFSCYTEKRINNLICHKPYEHYKYYRFCTNQVYTDKHSSVHSF